MDLTSYINKEETYSSIGHIEIGVSEKRAK